MDNHILPMLQKLSEQEASVFNNMNVLSGHTDKAETEALQKIQARENPYLAGAKVSVVRVPDVQPPITPHEVLDRLAGTAEAEKDMTRAIVLGAALVPKYVATIFVAEGEDIDLRSKPTADDSNLLAVLDQIALPGINFVFRSIDTPTADIQRAVTELAAGRTENPEV